MTRAQAKRWVLARETDEADQVVDALLALVAMEVTKAIEKAAKACDKSTEEYEYEGHTVRPGKYFGRLVRFANK